MVWLTFKMDLVEQNNGLNPDLRASILSLAAWVEKQTQGVLSGEKSVKPLIDINRSIIDGLSGRSAEAAE
jgi:flagellar protein FlaF